MAMTAGSILRPEAQERGDAVGGGVVLRPAVRGDCRRIAELFQIASEGVADYVWSRLAADHPGLSLLEIGERRYQRENTAFSYQNCLIAEHEGEAVGMLHAFPIEADAVPADPATVDPVLRPYAELEVPGSRYVSSLALLPSHRGQGIGWHLLGAASEQAAMLRLPTLSLLCFEANHCARRLYERHGFEVVDRRPIVPHPLIHAPAGDALLMAAPVRARSSASEGA